MHFPAIWTSKFTDLANSKKTQSLGKTAVDKSAWIKAWGYIHQFQTGATHKIQ